MYSINCILLGAFCLKKDNYYLERLQYERWSRLSPWPGSFWQEGEKTWRPPSSNEALDPGRHIMIYFIFWCIVVLYSILTVDRKNMTALMSSKEALDRCSAQLDPDVENLESRWESGASVAGQSSQCFDGGRFIWRLRTRKSKREI